MEKVFVDEISEREMMNKTRNNSITALDYADKTLLVLSSVSSGVSICSFSTDIGEHVGVASASISLAFLGCENIFEKIEGE